MKVTRHFGKPERVDINEIQIPDLWHLYEWALKHEKLLRSEIQHDHLFIPLPASLENPPVRKMTWAEAILETWNVAHDLKKNIQENLIAEE